MNAKATIAKPKMFMTIPEAAEYASISMRHFRRLYYEKGDGKFIQIGRKFFVLTRDLEAWMSRRKAS